MTATLHPYPGLQALRRRSGSVMCRVIGKLSNLERLVSSRKALEERRMTRSPMGYPVSDMGTFTRRTPTSLGGHGVLFRQRGPGAYTPINRGDVLFPTSGETIEDIGKSAVNLMHTQVFCGGDLIVFRPMVPMEPKFAGYSLDCHSALKPRNH